MKISQKQAGLLAREVLNQLRRQKIGEVPEVMVNQLKKFIDKRKELLANCKHHDEALADHESSFKKIVGNNLAEKKVYSSDTLPRMIEKLKELEFPRLQAIEDEIILGAMFASDDDLKSFIDKIVKKFDKKVKSKILQN